MAVREEGEDEDDGGDGGRRNAREAGTATTTATATATRVDAATRRTAIVAVANARRGSEYVAFVARSIGGNDVAVAFDLLMAIKEEY